MPGDGTKLATTTHSPPPARLLDITRSISRAGQGPTGVDRVEQAYLRHLCETSTPFLAIARTTLGFVLLERHAAQQIADRATRAVPWGDADRLSRLARRKPLAVRRAESDLRRFALARSRPRGLGAMLARHLPGGFAYLNTGHSNLTDRMFRAVRQDAGGRVAVLIHDTIPLDYPQLQRPGAPDKFRAALRRVRANADLVICNSAHTEFRVLGHMRDWGAPPPVVVAPLGVAVPEPGPLPAGLNLPKRFFVVLGTIEPRKGHALLLDAWDDLMARHGPDTPGLVIVGRRGWNNEEVFARLDRLPPDGPVREVSGLDDPTVAALVIRSRGLLFPSLAEGFGLPPIEAAALGVPVVCSDLPAIREQLHDIPVYLNPADRYQWVRTVETLAADSKERSPRPGGNGFVPPSWDDHFNRVLRFT